MLIFEVENKKITGPESNLVTALELIRHRYKDEDKLPKISTNSIINLVVNSDANFNYDSLVQANEHPAVKSIIKSFNKDYVELHPVDSEDKDTTTNTPQGQSTDAPVDTVSNMAKRAGKKRNKSIY